MKIETPKTGFSFKTTKYIPEEKDIKNFMQMLEEVIDEKKEEVSKLIKTRSELSAFDFDQKTNLDTYLTLNERNYISAKKLSLFETVIFPPNYEDMDKGIEVLYETYGRTCDFKAEFEKISDEHYKFKLPIFTKKQLKDKYGEDGNATSLTIRWLLLKAYQNQTSTSIIEDATIILIYHYDKNKNPRYLPDPDNLDLKSCIDSVQGFLIEDDNISTLSVFQTSKEDTEEYTEMHVLSSENKEKIRKLLDL